MWSDRASSDYDVIIIGAGLSGINAAYRLQTECPGFSYAILEGRSSMGGTWDFFKYPGVRCDSDMHTFGYDWRPWLGKDSIADGADIRQYLEDSARENGIYRHILFSHRVEAADWSSKSKQWTLSVKVDGTREKHLNAGFVVMAAGYYDYEHPLGVTIPGLENFQGTVVHPQFWPEDLDYEGKHVAIIGSGATAVTLLPTLAKKAARVTMVQRSPTYIASLPREDPVHKLLGRFIPQTWASRLVRLKSLILGSLFVSYCRAFPRSARDMIVDGAERQLADSVPIKPHFEPNYNPWDQRLCVCPDGDFYAALRERSADIITGEIALINRKSITFKDSDLEISPDIIVTATGLKMQVAGGATLSINGKAIKVSQKHMWNAVLLEDTPNFGAMVGYTNAAWTLGSDCAARLITRLLNYMKKNGHSAVVPKISDSDGIQDVPILDLHSTYIHRAESYLPKAGSKDPWCPRRSYFRDFWTARYGSLTRGLEYL